MTVASASAFSSSSPPAAARSTARPPPLLLPWSSSSPPSPIDLWNVARGAAAARTAAFEVERGEEKQEGEEEEEEEDLALPLCGNDDGEGEAGSSTGWNFDAWGGDSLARRHGGEGEAEEEEEEEAERVRSSSAAAADSENDDCSQRRGFSSPSSLPCNDEKNEEEDVGDNDQRVEDLIDSMLAMTVSAFFIGKKAKGKKRLGKFELQPYF